MSDTPRPFSPQTPPAPPVASGETELGKGETSSALYRTSSDAYLFSSDKGETNLGKGELSSDKGETEKGKEETSSDKGETEKGKEETSFPPVENRPAPAMRAPQSLPSSPVERARLEIEAGGPKNEFNDRSTQVAFALLFVVPLLIILLSVLLFIPFISHQMNDDPSGVRTQPSANGQTPSR